MAIAGFTGAIGGSSDTDATSYTSSSFTPTADRLQLLAVESAVNGSAPAAPTVTGNSLTWVQVATVTFGSDIGFQRRLSLFRALGAAPAAGAVTVDFGGVTQGSCLMFWAEFSGTSVAGSNGSGAIVQAVTAAEDTGTTATSISVALAAFASADHRTYACVAHTQGEATTPRASWTELRDSTTTHTLPQTGLETQWSDAAAADTTASGSWTTGSRAAIIAVEIAVPGAATTTYQPGFRYGFL